MKVATANAPHRLAPHGPYFQRIADKGCVLIAAQEHADGDDWTPDGWRRFRPEEAQRSTLYYNPAGGARRTGWFHLRAGTRCGASSGWTSGTSCSRARTWARSKPATHGQPATSAARRSRRGLAGRGPSPGPAGRLQRHEEPDLDSSPDPRRRWSQPRPSGPHRPRSTTPSPASTAWNPHTVAWSMARLTTRPSSSTWRSDGREHD